MIVYVTKYALTTGIEVHEVDYGAGDHGDQKYVYTKMDLGFQQFVLGRNAFHTYPEAADAARVMRYKKAASLKKQLDRVSGLIFPSKTPDALLMKVTEDAI